jgi:hypothetical protein
MLRRNEPSGELIFHSTLRRSIIANVSFVDEGLGPLFGTQLWNSCLGAMIQAGADISVPDEEGYCAFILALWWGTTVSRLP